MMFTKNVNKLYAHCGEWVIHIYVTVLVVEIASSN